MGFLDLTLTHLTLQLFHRAYPLHFLPLPVFLAFALSRSFSLLLVHLPWRTLGRADKFLWAIGLPVAMVTGGKAAPLII